MMDVCRGQTVEVGFFSCKEAFRCLSTSSSSFVSDFIRDRVSRVRMQLSLEVSAPFLVTEQAWL